MTKAEALAICRTLADNPGRKSLYRCVKRAGWRYVQHADTIYTKAELAVLRQQRIDAENAERDV